MIAPAISSWTSSSVRGVAIVRVGPKLAAGGHVDESSRNQQLRDAPLERTREDGLHAELTPGRLRIALRPLEVENDSQRSNAKRAQLRDLLDQALGDAVTQVLEVLVAGGVRQRQHRQRANRRSGGELPPPGDARTGHRESANAQPDRTPAGDRECHQTGGDGGRWLRSGRLPQARGRGLNPFERGAHIRRARRASSRILDEAAGDRGPELDGDVRGDDDRIVAENRGAQLERIALERPRARGHFVEHNPESPDVAGHLHALAAQLLGRHVWQRADCGPCLRQRGAASRRPSCPNRRPASRDRNRAP